MTTLVIDRSHLVRHPLALFLAFPEGRRTTHDFATLPCQGVALDLARPLLDLCTAHGDIKSPATSANYAGALRAFCYHLNARPRSPRRLRNVTAMDLTTFFTSPSCPHKGDIYIKVLLRRAAALDKRSVNPDVLAHAESPPRMGRRARTIPVPPLSEGEERRLVAACKADIDALERRLAEGRAILLGEAPSPCLPVLVALSEHGPLSVDELTAKLNSSAAGLTGRGGIGYQTIWAMIWPTRADLIPFMLLLGLQTGLPPESIVTARISDVTWIARDQVRISTDKQRALGFEADTFSARTRWSPGRLLERLEAITAGIRPLAAASIADRHFIYMRRRVQGEPTALTVTFSRRAWAGRISLWAEKHGVLDDNGQPLAANRMALRKSFYRRLDRRHRGSVPSIAGPNQTERVAVAHYLDTEGETPLLSRTIETAERELVARAHIASQPVVLEEGEVERLKLNPTYAGHLLDMKPESALNLLTGESDDVFLAKCKDFFHSPFAASGSSCAAPVWECLRCKLAVITPSKLPNLLAFVDHLERQRDSLTVEEWDRRYSVVYRIVIEDILPRFSDSVLATARKRAATAALYLPPEEAS